MTRCSAVAACVLAPVVAGAGTARPAVSLVASPAHVNLTGKSRQTIRVTNSGRALVVVDTARAGYALDLRGRPRVAAGTRAAASWLAVRPRRLSLPPGGSALLTIASTPPRRAEPGDHGALVLLTTRPRPNLGLAVRMRLGVVVVMRIPGRIVRRLELLRLRVRAAGRARVLELVVANRGNVTEVLERGCVRVTFRRRGRVLARFRLPPRQLLPRTRGLFEARYSGRARGRMTARVELTGRGVCVRAAPRSFAVRL